ncbi:ferritin family protein [Inediibacterium massiliense]|uniref:ferritin family protein n=1 Tax=Inediibacterium massiliense TaxID=1658111 RepID=UPI0006B45FDC|nr:ferritin family protein [Inediibacterium massiliense]
MGVLKCLICGMNISLNSYHFNEYSFIERNRKEDIIHCPFCGVQKNYLDEKKELYKVESQNLDEESIKILDKAMKLEIFNGQFYEEASKLAKDETIKKIFKDLGNIELMHARVHQRLGGFEKLPILHKPDYTRHGTDELLLEEANKREEHAIAFYERNSYKVSSVTIKTIFKALSDVEKQHEMITHKYA